MNSMRDQLIIQFLSLGKSPNACKQTPAAKALACFLLALETEG
jgi:hypothetical protein